MLDVHTPRRRGPHSVFGNLLSEGEGRVLSVRTVGDPFDLLAIGQRAERFSAREIFLNIILLNGQIRLLGLLGEEILSLVVVPDGEETLIGKTEMAWKRFETSHDFLHPLVGDNLFATFELA